MSRLTTNYGYNISEGSDLVNPLVDIFPNWESIDSDLKDVSDDAVGRATELTTGTVHALTRSDTHRNVFVFTATSAFTAGDTFTLDGTQVSALTPAGEQLATGCYIIGSDVLVAVHGTLMTMYVSPTKVADSDKLDGHDSTYFATASDLSDLSDDLDAVSNKVGTGVLTTTAQDCVGAINELNSDLTNYFTNPEIVVPYSNFHDFNLDYSNFNDGDKLHVIVHDESSSIYYVKDLIVGIELGHNLSSVHPISVGGFYVNATSNGSCFVEVTTAEHLKFNSIYSNGTSVSNTAKITVLRYKAL